MKMLIEMERDDFIIIGGEEWENKLSSVDFCYSFLDENPSSFELGGVCYKDGKVSIKLNREEFLRFSILVGKNILYEKYRCRIEKNSFVFTLI